MHDTHLKMRGIARDIDGPTARASLAVEHMAGHSDASVSPSECTIVQAIDRVTEIYRQEFAEAQSAQCNRAVCPFCIEQLVQQVVGHCQLSNRDLPSAYGVSQGFE